MLHTCLRLRVKISDPNPPPTQSRTCKEWIAFKSSQHFLLRLQASSQPTKFKRPIVRMKKTIRLSLLKPQGVEMLQKRAKLI